MKGSGHGNLDLLLELIEESTGEGLFGRLELDDISECGVFREKLADLGRADGFVEIDIMKSGCTVDEWMSG